MSTKRSDALGACAKLLSPLVPLLLQLGVSAGEFAALCKSVYVRAAAVELAKRKRRVSQSGIAIITGLTRAEVKKHLSESPRLPATKQWEQQRASRVIQGWRNDPEYSLPSGKTRDLDPKGRKRSFNSLVRKYSGDIPVRAMLDELIAIGAVERRATGRLRLVTQIAGGPARGHLQGLGEKTHDLIATLVNNLDSCADWRFEGSVSAAGLDEQLASVLKERIAAQGRNFLEIVDDQMRHPPISRRKTRTLSRTLTRLGVNIFVHEQVSQPKARGRRPKGH